MRMVVAEELQYFLSGMPARRELVEASNAANEMLMKSLVWGLDADQVASIRNLDKGPKTRIYFYTPERDDQGGDSIMPAGQNGGLPGQDLLFGNEHYGKLAQVAAVSSVRGDRIRL